MEKKDELQKILVELDHKKIYAIEARDRILLLFDVSCNEANEEDEGGIGLADAIARRRNKKDGEVAVAFADFQKTNRVEVHFDSSQQYLCYINYKEGDGAYGLGMTFLESLQNGIEKYKQAKATDR